MERQEPAQTFGWPVVRTELVTSSERYGSVALGPDDQPSFDDLSSLAVRDGVGLPSKSDLVPQGTWLPTNRRGVFR